MGIFDIFRRGKPKGHVAEGRMSKGMVRARTPAHVVQEAVAAQGIQITASEANEIIDRVSNIIDFERVLPEEICYESNSAGLKFAREKYVIQVSLHLMDGAGIIPKDKMNTLYSCAVYWASANEIARAKGLTELCLKEGQRIALLDHGGLHNHPIYSFFPDLLRKTVLQ